MASGDVEVVLDEGRTVSLLTTKSTNQGRRALPAAWWVQTVVPRHLQKAVRCLQQAHFVLSWIPLVTTVVALHLRLNPLIISLALLPACLLWATSLWLFPTQSLSHAGAILVSSCSTAVMWALPVTAVILCPGHEPGLGWYRSSCSLTKAIMSPAWNWKQRYLMQ